VPITSLSNYSAVTNFFITENLADIGKCTVNRCHCLRVVVDSLIQAIREKLVNIPHVFTQGLKKLVYGVLFS
jgi:hypothetical protein